ncbi:GNAT family N-acetyltransferase [Streptomyces sp. NPDC046261]|uniref:GNAT family N-acetyltransferase n=1 Tax=Streptomyces sp. NPDC046261 TaxID=3157200 RepID=UPI00340E3D79
MDHSDPARRSLLDRIEEYYDAVPRSVARAEDFGPLTLFVREGRGWPFYGRPALGRRGAAVTAADVLRVRARQRELGLPESFEWVAETTPALRAAAEEAGLVVREHPLMALDDAATLTGLPAAAGDGVSVRVVGADDPALAAAVAVPFVAFGEPGTGVGTAGPEAVAAVERTLVADGTVGQIASRVRAGLTAVALATENGTPLCAGQHQPAGAVSELVGIGTLPAARRRGLGLALTAALVADARSRGMRTVFLSAGDESVARVYARAGFRRVGTALIASPGA